MCGTALLRWLVVVFALRITGAALAVVVTSLACSASAPAQVRGDAEAQASGLVAFVRDGDIYVMHPDRSGLRRLTHSKPPDNAQGPAWSPDGTKIAFTSQTYPTHEYDDVAVINASGSGLRTLSGPSFANVDPTWSRDGHTIAFAAFSDTFRLYLVRVRGGVVRPLGGLSGGGPAWSPDGRLIAYTRGQGHSRLYLVRPDGTGLRKLTSSDSGSPSWSPDGTQVAFDNGHDIFLINVDGSHLNRITSATVSEIEPTWSPDGKEVVYARGRSGRKGGYDLWIMKADGSGQRLLVRNAAEPDWSRR